MRHLRIIGLCLVAVFALTALAAAGTASAAGPEWGACVEAKSIGLKHGHYEDINCTKEKFKESKGVKKYSGKYEWKAGAPAAPECLAKKHGNYLTSACNTMKEKKGVPVEHKGKYEKGGPNFTGEGGAGTLRNVVYACYKEPLNKENELGQHSECTNTKNGFTGFHDAEVECTTEHASGEAVGSNEVANVKVLFTGCNALSLPANSPGKAAGEIETKTLKGRLGYINASAKEVGLLLEPATPGGEFAELLLTNGSSLVHVGVGNAAQGAFYEEENGAPTGNDGIISSIEPINQMTTKFTQNYRAEDITPYLPKSCPISHTCPKGEKALTGNNEDWVNVINHFEGGPFEALEVRLEATNHEEKLPWGPGAEEITNVNTVEGEAEIKG